jgi:hypothetical protein
MSHLNLIWLWLLLLLSVSSVFGRTTISLFSPGRRSRSLQEEAASITASLTTEPPLQLQQQQSSAVIGDMSSTAVATHAPKLDSYSAGVKDEKKGQGVDASASSSLIEKAPKQERFDKEEEEIQEDDPEDTEERNRKHFRTATGGIIHYIMFSLTIVSFIGNGFFMVYVFWLSK